MKAASLVAHLRDVLILPFTVTCIVPSLIYDPQQNLISDHLFIKITGGLFLAGGLSLFLYTVFLFRTIGKGTLAPWSPKQKLVVAGPYRYCRNPMITGVLFILIGETLVLHSTSILIWAATFFTINTFYFILSEEPGLLSRFGDEYREYKKRVPRWIPRLTPYTPIISYLLAASFLIGCKNPRQEDKPVQRPNIIIIMTDDHARNAVSAYGSRLIKTPNIDRLGREGILFKNAFVTNALCGPSRAVILTGKYSHINGFRDNNDRFDNQQATMPKILQLAGYYTAVVGKWHLVSEPTGFDYWNILIDQGSYYNPDFVQMGDTTCREGYATDIITDLALQTLDTRPADKPFYLMLHQKAPHRNWMPNLKDLAAFDSIEIPAPPTLFDDYKTRSAAAREQDMEIRNMFHAYDLKLKIPTGQKDPGTGGHAGGDGIKFWEGDYKRFTGAQKKVWDEYYQGVSDSFYKSKLKGKALEEWKYQRYIKDYLACVMSVDENIGKLLAYLESKKLLDNTLIIYTSDQGFFLGEHGWYDKRFMYEESLGTPLLMRYPEKIKAGQVNSDLVMNLDIAPTVLESAGVPVPADMQGKSLLQRSVDNTEPWRKGIYYHYYEFPYGAHKVKKHYGIRTDRYKLIHFYNDIDAWELFDLRNDPHEVNNLYGKKEFQPLADSLKTALNELRLHYRDTARLETGNP